MERRANLRLVIPIDSSNNHEKYVKELIKRDNNPNKPVDQYIKSKVSWILGGRRNMVCAINSAKVARVNPNDIQTGEPTIINFFDFSYLGGSFVSNSNFVDVNINMLITDKTYQAWSEVTQEFTNTNIYSLWFGEVISDNIFKQEVIVISSSNKETLGDRKCYKFYCETIIKDAL